MSRFARSLSSTDCNVEMLNTSLKLYATNATYFLPAMPRRLSDHIAIGWKVVFLTSKSGDRPSLLQTAPKGDVRDPNSDTCRPLGDGR